MQKTRCEECGEISKLQMATNLKQMCEYCKKEYDEYGTDHTYEYESTSSSNESETSSESDSSSTTIQNDQSKPKTKSK